MSESTQAIEVTMSNLTPKDFYNRLAEKVSVYNAKLLLDSALVSTGLKGEDIDTTLNAEQAKDLCLQLIKQGGPAFQVGQTIYREL